MRPVRIALVLAAFAVAFVLVADPALAGPGGIIARAVTKTFWGKAALVALFVLLLPLIAWVAVKEWRAERRALKILHRLGAVDPMFQPLRLKDRIHECFLAVHSAWSMERMSEATRHMTDWYWQNQELAHLRRWEAEGLVNRCSVRSVGRIRPLHVTAEVAGGAVRSASVVASITANMQDYLAQRATGTIVEGDEKFKDVETVWTFRLEGGALKVVQIEEDFRTMTYAGLPNLVPGLEEHEALVRARA